MVKQEERKKATRAALVASASTLFGTRGYEATSAEMIAEHAGVAKGSVYHHFDSKAVMFGVVFDELAMQVAAKCAEAVAAESDILAGLMNSVRMFFSCCAEPSTAQIILRDAPNVLGWEAWRQRDAKHFGGMVHMGLQAAMDSSAIRQQPVQPLAEIMLGAIQSAALDAAASDDFEEAADGYLIAMEAMLKGLR